MPEFLVIDANSIISAMLGGTAREVLFSGRFIFYSTQHTMFEVEKYLPSLAKRLGIQEGELFRAFQLLPIIVYQAKDYESYISKAFQMIGARDAKDVPILALTLSLGYPLWTEDRDFENLPGVLIRRTAGLMG